MNYKDDLIFSEVVRFVINSEGGYSNDPRDPGGPTKYGIAWNFNKPTLLKMGVGNVYNLTYDQAKQIYYFNYWLPSGGGNIPDKRLGYVHFDAVVNSGVGQGAKFLAQLSKNPKYFEGHGKNEALWLELVLEYIAIRLNFYTHSKNSNIYLQGWSNRLVAVIRNALSMKY